MFGRILSVWGSMSDCVEPQVSCIVCFMRAGLPSVWLKENIHMYVCGDIHIYIQIPLVETTIPSDLRPI